MTTHKDLRIGWLLLLLRSSTRGYGYELRRELGQRGLSLDAAVLYRSLRDMESGGLIASSWMHSEEGPRRRVYTITAGGRSELGRIAARVRDSREAEDAFLKAYREHRRQRRAASSRGRA